MALTIKLLKDGAGSGSYTPNPAGKAAVIKSIVVTNTGANSQTVSITLKARNICPPLTSLPAKTSLILEAEITLANPDSLAVTCSHAEVEWVVSGIERDN